MRTVTRAIAGTLLGIVIVLGVLSAAWNFALKGTPLEDMIGTGVANAALDASGIKGQIDSTLRENVSAIASATGMSESQVTSAIDQLNIESWSVTTLPSDASATGTFNTTYQGASATVTTYADPSYVTVDALGQELTLSVPESAQSYVSLLAYLWQIDSVLLACVIGQDELRALNIDGRNRTRAAVVIRRDRSVARNERLHVT